MLSCNPRSDKFSVKLPHNFFLTDVVEKYNRYIDLNDSYFKTIDQLVNESIIGIDIPGLAQNLAQQTTAPHNTTGGIETDITFYPGTQPIEEVVETTNISITFRHLDSYINYFCLFEIFYMMYMKKINLSKDRFSIPVTCLSTNNHPVFNVVLSKCIFQSISGLPLTYNNQSRDFKEFTCVFNYSDITIDFDLPQGTALTYNK